MISENAKRYENVVIRNDKEVGINTFGLDYLVGLEEENERLNNIINKTNWYLKQMLAQVENKVAKAIINGALDLLLKGSDKE